MTRAASSKPVVRLSNPFGDDYWEAVVYGKTSWGPRTPFLKVRALSLQGMWDTLAKNWNAVKPRA